MNNEVEIKENQDKKANIKKLCKKKAKQYIWISLGVLLMTLGYFFFFKQSGIVAGGVTGLEIVLSPLFSNVSWYESSYFLYVAEGICLILGLIFIGKELFIKTVYAALLSPTIIFIF